MTPEELIAIIEQSPELQKAIRKYVLTEEFLAVPARLGRIESDAAYLQAGHVRLEQGQARLEQGQARLEDRMNKLDGRMDRLDGYRYEQKAIENCRSIITRQTGMGRVKIRFSQANHPEDPEDDGADEPGRRPRRNFPRRGSGALECRPDRLRHEPGHRRKSQHHRQGVNLAQRQLH